MEIEEVTAHLQHENRDSERQSDPEATGHILEFGAWPFFYGSYEGFQGHAADGAITGNGLPNLRVHGAGIDDTSRRRVNWPGTVGGTMWPFVPVMTSMPSVFGAFVTHGRSLFGSIAASNLVCIVSPLSVRAHRNAPMRASDSRFQCIGLAAFGLETKALPPDTKSGLHPRSARPPTEGSPWVKITRSARARFEP